MIIIDWCFLEQIITLGSDKSSKFFTGQFLRYSKGNLMTINNMSIKIKVCGSLHRNSMLVTHDNSDNVLTVNAS